MVDGSSGDAFEMEATDCAIRQFDGWDDGMKAFEAALAELTGGTVPQTVGETARGASGLTVRLSQRRLWLLCDGALPPLGIDPALGCSLDLAEGRVRLRLSGARVGELLERCVAVDWAGVPPGRAVQTGFHGVPVVLVRSTAKEWDLIVPRSFARAVSESVADTAAGSGMTEAASGG